jgi:excisionase family DNA binding protein
VFCGRLRGGHAFGGGARIRESGTVTVERAAQRLHLDLREVYTLVHGGELAMKSFGPRDRVPTEEVEPWAKADTQQRRRRWQRETARSR